MDYITVLNYEHLDNSLFLTSFARAVARKQARGIVLHGDSEYTNRIIQTGVMREEAVVRAMKDLNHRLIALLADEGVPAIGLNGFQKSLVSVTDGKIRIDIQQLHSLPEVPLLVISALGDFRKPEGNSVEPISLPLLAEAFVQQSTFENLTLFSIDEQSAMIKQPFPDAATPEKLPLELRQKHIASDFLDLSVPVQLTTPDQF